MPRRTIVTVFPRVALVCLAASLLSSRPVRAAADKPEEPQEASYIRVERDPSEKPLALQTAIVHFIAAGDERKDVTVDLVGAVHVGEKSYYDALNEAFTHYDVVLYELVAPEGTRIPKGTKAGGRNPLGALQNGLKSMLNLEHQLEFVDYTQPNFVHADMSADDLFKSMKDRGESFWTMFLKMMAQAMAEQAKQQAQGKSNDAALLMALFDKNQALALKRVMAEQFGDINGAMRALDGPEGSTLVTERNKVALKQLTKQIADGKKHIAIFYGAGHMADMEKRLIGEFGLKRAEEKWLTAWSLIDPKAQPMPAPAPAVDQPPANPAGGNQ